jgi:hypothetical protein
MTFISMSVAHESVAKQRKQAEERAQFDLRFQAFCPQGQAERKMR